MVKDMTVGSPTKLLLSFTVPLLIGNIFQQFYSMVDAIIVGRFVSTDGLAAVGVTGSMSFLVLGFVQGMTSGFAVPVSQRFGAEDYGGMRRAVAMSVYLSLAMTVIVTLLSVFTAMPLLRLIDTPENIIGDAYRYIVVIFAGTGAAVFYNMISCVLRALGDSKTPLYFLIVASLLNVVLDLVFILNFSMGVAGAAWATVISQAVSAILCLVYMIKRYPILKFQRQDWRLNLPVCAAEIKIGLPMALQFSITAVGVMILQSAINSFGSDTVAAYTAASKVEQLATQALMSMGATMATYTGQNLGAGRIDRIRLGARRGVMLSILFSVIGGLIVVVFGDQLLRLFITGDQPRVMAEARLYINITSAGLPVLGVLFVFRNTLQGMGDGLVPMLAGFFEVVVRVLVAFFVAKWIGYVAICIASPGAWLAAALPLTFTYLKRMHAMLEADRLRQSHAAGSDTACADAHKA